MKKAWTMAEFTVALLIIIVLSFASMTSIKKTSTNKDKLFMYATLKNLMYANGSIIDKFGGFPPANTNNETTWARWWNENKPNGTASEWSTWSTNAKDWYCSELKDVFSLSEDVDCSSTTAVFKFANGVTIEGLTKPWHAAYTYKNPNTEACVDGECEAAADFYYKNILVDINGSQNPNKLGIDKFPLRIYNGFSALGTDLSGIVAPACGPNDKTHDSAGNENALTGGVNYCDGDSFDFINDNEIMSYNIYRVDNSLIGTKRWTTYVDSSGTQQSEMKDKTVNATLVVGQLSYMKADCLANGGNGVYDKIQCSSAGYNLHPDCVNHDLCKDCTGMIGTEAYNVCPSEYNSVTSCQDRAKTLNSADLPDQSCYVMLNKPLNGLGFFAGLILGDIDM